MYIFPPELQHRKVICLCFGQGWFLTTCFLVLPLLTQAIGTAAMNTALSALYYEGFFIRWHRAIPIAKRWLLFLQKYSQATSIVYRRGLNRFSIVPKLHMLHHGAIRLLREAQRAQTNGSVWAINPLSESVQLQEDWIGRPSRLSRRVCPKQIHLRVCQRSLLSTMEHLKNADRDQRGLFRSNGP